jgi:hypothetical protein
MTTDKITATIIFPREELGETRPLLSSIGRCPLWVKRVVLAVGRPLPVYPEERTSPVRARLIPPVDLGLIPAGIDMASESSPPRYKGEPTTICPHLEAGGYRSHCRVCRIGVGDFQVFVVLAGGAPSDRMQRSRRSSRWSPGSRRAVTASRGRTHQRPPHRRVGRDRIGSRGTRSSWCWPRTMVASAIMVAL